MHQEKMQRLIKTKPSQIKQFNVLMKSSATTAPVRDISPRYFRQRSHKRTYFGRWEISVFPRMYQPYFGIDFKKRRFVGREPRRSHAPLAACHAACS